MAEIKHRKRKIILVLGTVLAYSLFTQQCEVPPKNLEEAKKAAIGVWIDDGLVMDRRAKMVFEEDGSYKYYLATKGDPSWGEIEGEGSYTVEQTEVMTKSGNTEVAYQIAWTFDGMEAEYIFESKSSVYNRSQVMTKGNRSKP